MATVDRPTRAATRMSVATLASRGIGFVRVLGDRRRARHHVPREHVPVVELGIERAVRAAGRGRAVGRARADASSTCSKRARTARRRDLASGLLGLALAVMGVVCVVGLIFGAADRAVALHRRAGPAASRSNRSRSRRSSSTSSSRRCCSTCSGTVATAILYAKRHFVITAIAPIANTVFVVASLVLFRVVAGPIRGSTSRSKRS